MTERKAATETPASKNDFGQAEAQKRASDADKKGFLGHKVDPRPNSDYSLESGPNSPGPTDALLRVDVADLPHKEESPNA